MTLKCNDRVFRLLTLVACLLSLAPVVKGETLSTEVTRIIRSANLGKATFGVLFTDLSNGEDLIQVNAEKPFVPASNLKLITTAAALSVLGKDHHFKTRLLSDGANLVVRGDGDPAFCDPVILDEIGLTVDAVLDRWVDAVKRTGRKNFDALIVDDRVFDRQFVHPNWPRAQLQAWYCAQVAGINFNDNCIDFYASPTTPGEPPRVRLAPQGWPVKIENKASTGVGKPLGLTRRLETNELILTGQINRALTSPLFVTIHDPPINFGGVFKTYLRNAGIIVGEVRRPREGEAMEAGELIASVETPLATILTRTNRDSQNLFAEALLKRLGHQATGQPGSWPSGIAAIQTYLVEALGGDADSVVLDDGSGLSRTNRVSPRAFVRVLDHMHSQSELGPIYRDSLAEPGERGTLRKRFAKGELSGKLYAKSGYINGVVTLSGYLTEGQRTIGFSMLLNNYPGGTSGAKTLMDKIILAVDRRTAKSTPPSDKPQIGG